MKFQLGMWTMAAFLAGPALAADITFTPPPGGGVVLNSSAGAPGLRVGPSGVQLPALPATPANLSSVVCHDGSGVLGRCDPASTTGAQGIPGPRGDTGATGVVGPVGPQGPKGDTGDRGVAGPAGPQGAVGAQGVPGAAGTSVTGLAEVRQGCFGAAANVLSGSAYSVAVAGKVFTVTFNPAMAAAPFTVVVDGRANSGRALAMGADNTSPNRIVFTVGWVDSAETIGSICFIAMR